MADYTDAERFVLEIKFEDKTKRYLNTAAYCSVGDPYYATRYPPVEDKPERQKSRDEAIRWMGNEYEATFSFIPFLEAVKEYKDLVKEEYDNN